MYIKGTEKIKLPRGRHLIRNAGCRSILVGNTFLVKNRGFMTIKSLLPKTIKVSSRGSELLIVKES